MQELINADVEKGFFEANQVHKRRLIDRLKAAQIGCLQVFRRWLNTYLAVETSDLLLFYYLKNNRCLGVYLYKRKLGFSFFV